MGKEIFLKLNKIRSTIIGHIRSGTCFLKPSKAFLLKHKRGKGKIISTKKILVCLSLYILWGKCVYFSIFESWKSQMDFFDIIVNFIIQKLKSKHTSFKKYKNWEKLSCLNLYIFLSFWGNERRQKPNILHHRHCKKNNESRQKRLCVLLAQISFKVIE